MTLDLITIFGAGLLTFVTPCVLPLIPVYLAALTGGDLSGTGRRGAVLVRASFFSAGFILVFTLMGLGASAIGGFLIDHRMAMQAAGAALITLFALKFMGVIRVPFLDRIMKADDTRLQTRFATLNALIMGIVFAAGWSPCVGPVLGTILTYTASAAASPAAGALYLGVYGLGFALPLLLVALFAEAGTRFIAKLSPHLPKVERTIGLLLLFIAGLMVIDIAPSSPPSPAPSVAGTGFTDGVPGRVSTDGVPGRDGMPVMLELYKEDCGVCEKMKPVVASIVDQCDEKGVRVRTIDISKPEHRHLASTYRLVGVPTFIFLDADGNEAARLLGEQTEQSLKQTISALRGEPCPGLARLEPELFPGRGAPATNNCNL